MDLKDLVQGLGSDQRGLAGALMDMIGGPSTGGGLQGLVDSFSRNGLGDIVSSWIATGPNKAVSADQIHRALGADALSQIASKAGIRAETAVSSIASLLPDLVDKLTPSGSADDVQNVIAQGMALFKKMG